MTAYVPWLLSCFTVASLWLVAERRRAGFLVGLAAQPFWVALDISVHAWGLLPLALILGTLYLRGWRKWGRA